MSQKPDADVETVLESHHDVPDTARIIDTRDDVPEDQKNQVLNKAQIISLWNGSGLDLLMVSPETDHSPAIYKLLDFGKYKFDLQKRNRELERKKRENTRTVKEFKFAPAISDHDFGIKVDHIREALPKHDIKLTMKINFDARKTLGRAFNPHVVKQDPEFVLNRVIRLFEDTMQISPYNVGHDHMSIMMRPKPIKDSK